LFKFLIIGVVSAKTSFIPEQPSENGAAPADVGKIEAGRAPVPMVGKIKNVTTTGGGMFAGGKESEEGYDYGNPKYGCMLGERPMQVLGVAGDFCSPECTTSHKCPTHTAPGVTATPQCALTTSSEQEFCVLICMSTSQCASGALCHPISGVGICTFPAADATFPEQGKLLAHHKLN